MGSEGVAQKDTNERGGGGVGIGERGIVYMPENPGGRKRMKQNQIGQSYRTPSPAMSMNLVLLFIAFAVILGVSDPRTSPSSKPSPSSWRAACSAILACRSQNIFPSAS